jgi:hypothetical protein
VGVDEPFFIRSIQIPNLKVGVKFSTGFLAGDNLSFHISG